ncbi:beta-lactamase family protein [Sphingobium sp. AS12]|uniref:serine hydrolase domain-containing protein n=1 Tax=Sphingobium sp. AS12 TaxID=2849495 RepID=UPI001C317BDE|nr:serine hydrolase domain-containing protein [Sphingobium sp. AS12]MBV2149852.1 beta-lactamase family protein [Sphingobium sp. AS12]
MKLFGLSPAIRGWCLIPAVLLAASASDARTAAPSRRSPAQIKAFVARAMEGTGARGLAIAVIEDGRVAHVGAYGFRNAKDEPLTADTVMYAASLTKTVFAYTVMQLAGQGRLDLDRPIAALLPRPLPDYGTDADVVRAYADYGPLADDPRWRAITPRMVLDHSTGFANYFFFEDDKRARIHFDPGTRYAYSGDGMILLQLGIEKGLGFSIGALTDANFRRLGMTHTSLVWRDDFAANMADGWTADGAALPHDERSRVRAAGSMDTTIADFARFAAAFVRGEGLSPASRAEMVRPQLRITSSRQFPTLWPQLQLPPEQQRSDLAAGLGVIVFAGPQGPGFYKGGHDDATGNTMVCVERGRRCVVILANDVRAERAFPAIVRFILGETGAPWDWEYGDLVFWDGIAPSR